MMLSAKNHSNICFMTLKFEDKFVRALGSLKMTVGSIATS